MKTGNIQESADGTYRWVYEFNMLTNPVILLTIWKIFFLILLGMWLFFGLFKIKDAGLIGAYKQQTLELMIPAVILLVLSVVAYIILAFIYGFKYCVLFEMNEKGVRHIQMPKQFKKAQALGILTALAGAAAGNPAVTGSGILSSVKSEQYSDFSKVRRIRKIRIFRTIKLHSLLSHNQIYTAAEDFDFVADYIETQIAKSRDGTK